MKKREVSVCCLQADVERMTRRRSRVSTAALELTVPEDLSWSREEDMFADVDGMVERVRESWIRGELGIWERSKSGVVAAREAVGQKLCWRG